MAHEPGTDPARPPRHRAPLRALLGEVRDGPADHQFTDRSGQYHRIWAIRDAARARRASPPACADARALIADGHHRYAAYLRLQASTRPGPATDAGLAMLVDQDDTPLLLGAIHRILAGADARRPR